MLAKFILFGLTGIIASLVITAAKRTFETKRIEPTGEASLVLFPFFGLIAFIYPVIAIHVGQVPWYLRGVIYMLAFYVGQFLTGLILEKIGLCPWSYSDKFSFHGVIRLADAPMWYLCGLALEWLYPYIKAFATVV